MKVIVSHDIDHLTAWEHSFKDAILPKYILRMHIELVLGKIRFKEYLLRTKSLFNNKWNHIEDLINFNRSMGIPSQFFIGVNNGVGLSYSIEKAHQIMLQHQTHDVHFGVHGIAFDDPTAIQREYDRFKQLAAESQIGMRMHYVRKVDKTMHWIAQAGYAFDSTEFGFLSPYRIESMWEFPFQIMDSWVMEQGKRWQSVNLERAKEITLAELARAEKAELPYLGIIFHDHYFSPAHQTWMNWYTWFMETLKNKGYTFIRFGDAIKELET